MRRTTTSLLLASALAGGLAAGGDDDETGTAGAGTGTGATVPESDEPTSAPAEEGGTVTIDIAQFAFSPREVEVAAGTGVVWSNKDDFAHTAQDEGDAFDTGSIDAGASSEPVVLEPGTYSYICGIHNSMTGTLVVTG